ncbi:hypothetical protein PAHAL_1G060200 [Panicum hallii]|uniref:Uncharacterized protein n=1 Tax=Panicum hallii TaxID=206008 RepID=A0A2T8KU48_9POAL|nr:hypothetical protein PAHAL_1G060200 [Panicum hallii]
MTSIAPRRRDLLCSSVTATVMRKVEEELARAPPPLSMGAARERSSQGRCHRGGVAPSRAMENPWHGRSICLRWWWWPSDFVVPLERWRCRGSRRWLDPSPLHPPQAIIHRKLDLLGTGGARFLVLVVL